MSVNAVEVEIGLLRRLIPLNVAAGLTHDVRVGVIVGAAVRRRVAAAVHRGEKTQGRWGQRVAKDRHAVGDARPVVPHQRLNAVRRLEDLESIYLHRHRRVAAGTEADLKQSRIQIRRYGLAGRDIEVRVASGLQSNIVCACGNRSANVVGIIQACVIDAAFLRANLVVIASIAILSKRHEIQHGTGTIGKKHMRFV